MRAVLGLVAALAPCSTPHREEGREPPSPVAKPVAPVAKPIEVRAIGSGWSQSCALLADGDVRCWPPGAKPASVLITGAIALAVAERHACVAKPDGSVWCWGDNRDGQLGDGTTTAHAAPLRVAGLEKIVEVAAGGFYTCARDQAGAVWCWGRPEFGGTKPTRIAVPAAKSIVAGEETVCVTFDKAPPQCWGFNIDTFDELGPVTKPTAKTAFAKATAFAIGARHACMVYEGVVFCAGEDQFGQLGDQHVPENASCTHDEHTVTCEWVEYPPPEPPPPPGAPLPPMYPERSRPGPTKHQKTFAVRSGYATPAMTGSAVVIGEFRTCAIDRDTNAECWDSSHRAPTLIVNTHGTTALAVGSHDACALLADHSVWCWGENSATAAHITF